MVELNILSEVEQAEEPKQQEDRQPKTGGVPKSAHAAGDQRPKAAEAAKPTAPEDQARKTGAAADGGAAADAGAMIRDVEPRLVRKLIDVALEGNFRAISYLLDRIRRVDQIKLAHVEISEDGVENLRKLLNAYTTGKIDGKEAKAAAGQLEAFVKAANALDAKVGLTALQRQVDANERMLIQLVNALKQTKGKKGS